MHSNIPFILGSLYPTFEFFLAHTYLKLLQHTVRGNEKRLSGNYKLSKKYDNRKKDLRSN